MVGVEAWVSESQDETVEVDSSGITIGITDGCEGIAVATVPSISRDNVKVCSVHKGGLALGEFDGSGVALDGIGVIHSPLSCARRQKYTDLRHGQTFLGGAQGSRLYPLQFGIVWGYNSQNLIGWLALA